MKVAQRSYLKAKKWLDYHSGNPNENLFQQVLSENQKWLRIYKAAIETYTKEKKLAEISANKQRRHTKNELIKNNRAAQEALKDAWRAAKNAHANLVQANVKRQTAVETLNFAQSRYQQSKLAMDSFIVSPLSEKELKEN